MAPLTRTSIRTRLYAPGRSTSAYIYLFSTPCLRYHQVRGCRRGRDPEHEIEREMKRVRRMMWKERRAMWDIPENDAAGRTVRNWMGFSWGSRSREAPEELEAALKPEKDGKEPKDDWVWPVTKTRVPSYEYDMWQSPLQNIRNMVRHAQEVKKELSERPGESTVDFVDAIVAEKKRLKGETVEHVEQHQQSREPERVPEMDADASEVYEIDPITNRRVPRSQAEPASTFDDDPRALRGRNCWKPQVYKHENAKTASKAPASTPSEDAWIQGHDAWKHRAQDLQEEENQKWAHPVEDVREVPPVIAADAPSTVQEDQSEYMSDVMHPSSQSATSHRIRKLYYQSLADDAERPLHKSGVRKSYKANIEEKPSVDDLANRKARLEEVWDRAYTEAHVAVKTSKQDQAPTENESLPDNKQTSREFTGNYVRDFPEEFARSWSGPDPIPVNETKNAPGESSSGSPLYKPSESARPEEPEISSMDGDFPALEPALNRQRRSTESQTVNSSADTTQSTVTRNPVTGEFSSVEVGSNKMHGEDPACSSETNTPEAPVIYKILAYDPIMQHINIAETTSSVPDTVTPLTPSEALLRVSNPSKFFPHFAPLQAQGYEILSGSGDVLVFRKARAATASSRETNTTNTANSLAEQQSQPGPTVNPIDMMGGNHFPENVTGNYASPTGFVNYNALEYDEEGRERLKPPPPFRSGIDVKREEEVFSGTRRVGQEDVKEKNSRTGRRMVLGAVWLGGLSYAAAVVGEYFRTGGVDGMGPSGF